jgi:hypothetical protein
MKGLAWCLTLALLLSACATAVDSERANAIYIKYDSHCREHARDIIGEVDEESRYQECMNYFVTTDVNCPTCIVDPHLK